MATIATGAGHAARRKLDHDLPLVPFIDFLLCLVAFLLVTAVWSQMARLRADARVPGVPGVAAAPIPELHVSVEDADFLLRWKVGDKTLVESQRVARTPVVEADGTLRYPELGHVAQSQWAARGAHRAATDHAQDRAVLHTPNSLAFAEVTAVLDALQSPKRPFAIGGRSEELPVFAVAFATD
jgi:biopolymer transport protein ExbD